MNIGVILAAGDSKRFNSPLPKQYLKLNGKELIYYSLQQMRQAYNIDDIVLVVDKVEFDLQYISAKYGVNCVVGGATRNESIQNAINYICEKYGCDCKLIFHDSSRPFTMHNIFEKYIDLLKKYDCVATTTKITDSLVVGDGKYVDRNDYSLVQTPEAVKMSVMLKYFDSANFSTAIVQQLESKCVVYMCPNNDFNMKITYPEELFLAEQFMRVAYSSCRHTEDNVDLSKLSNVLILGASGGIGQAVKKYFAEKNINCCAPTHDELDLRNITVEKIKTYLGEVSPNAIINCAAVYCDDSVSLVDSFDDIFNTNVKSNLVFIEYAKTLGTKVNIVVLSSSSSTMGRENLTNYSACKAALNSIVESQAPILKNKNIYLNAIVPEKVNTPLISKLHKTDINIRELLDVSDVINAILYCSTSEQYGKLIHIRKGL